MESAHRCTLNGQVYIHIVLRRGGNTLISVILTKRTAAETFPRAIAAHVVHVSGIPVHGGSLDGYPVASCPPVSRP